MATRRSTSLKPQLNQIRAWVQDGATDIWIAHKLGTTPAALIRFRKQHDLLRENERPPEPPPAPEPEVTATVEETKPRRSRRGGRSRANDADDTPVEPEVTAPADEPKPRRSRRGGRSRAKDSDDTPVELEGVFDHGDEGYGLWLDGAVRDAGVYRTHWQGHADVTVKISPDEIVIRRR